MMPRAGQKSVTLSARMYSEIEAIVRENQGHFDGVSDFVKHAIVELSLRVRDR